MKDYPPADELLEAVAAFLDEEVKPLLKGGQRFKSIVAANACRVVAREAAGKTALVEEQRRGLSELLGKDGELPAAVSGDDSSADELGRELCAAIAEGAYDQGQSREQLLAWLRDDVEARLRINDPAFLERNARRDK
ncbi:MAG TPA: hypothetical protein EYG16_05385 [Deltaproteobacteria bacterium]|nr:hypothetical protein [Candidatus Binatota bacterium]HIL13088.1 hypothetical protein [Deltaproteobacteria bacterium]